MKMQEESKKPIIQIKTKSHSFFSERYLKKLKEDVCIIQPLTSLCGGWYIETFKQVTNKLCKNKSSPIPLFFPNIQTMQPISKNKLLLKKVFDSFDTRGLGRIDASQVYCSFLLLSKGSFEAFLKTIIDIFGFGNTGRITRNQFFFFLDSFYRALPKILIPKGYDKPLADNNLRLQFEDINKFVDALFEGNKIDIERNQIYEQFFIQQRQMMKVQQLNEFLKYLQKKGTSAAEYSRIQALNKMKLQGEVRNCVSDMVLKVHMELQKDKKPKNKMVLQ